MWIEREREIEISINEIKPNDYLIVNIDQTGYYRVMYDESNWQLIINELNKGNFTFISPNTRAMLIDDAAVFVETEILQMRLFLEIIQYLEHEVRK